MGLFGRSKQQSQQQPQPQQSVNRAYKLDKRIDLVLQELKQKRAEKCQSMGFSALRTGQDLRYIERKTQELYTLAVAELKAGAKVSDTFQNLYDNHTVLDVDREIVERMFSGK